MNLTPHFTLEEFTASDEAVRRSINNTPPGEILPNLVRLAQFLEKVREVIGVQLIITSGFRCLELNRAIGSHDLSDHVDGRAADFKAPQFGTPLQVAQRIARSPLSYEQLIDERAWVHISIPRFEVKPRLQILTAHFKKGEKTTYTVGLA